MRHREPDTVDNIVATVHTVAPELPSIRLREIAMVIRREMGGRHYYVGRKEPRDAIGAADRPG